MFFQELFKYSLVPGFAIEQMYDDLGKDAFILLLGFENQSEIKGILPFVSAERADIKRIIEKSLRMKLAC